MYLITQDQKRIMSILDKTQVLTTAQVFCILKVSNERATEAYALRVIQQLRYMQKLRFESEDIITLPDMVPQRDKNDLILAAVDIMLDISEGAPLEVGSKSTPFILRFLTDNGDSIGCYGIIAVPLGGAARVNFQLEDISSVKQTIILLLADLKQREEIKTTRPHYFAVKDGNKYRYYADEN